MQNQNQIHPSTSKLVRAATGDTTVAVGEEGTTEPVTQKVKASKATTRPAVVFIDTPAPADGRLEAGLLKEISDEVGRQLRGDGRIGCVVYCLGQTRPLRRQDVENGLSDVSRLTAKHPKLHGAALVFAALQQQDEEEEEEEEEELESGVISVGNIVKERGLKVRLVSGTPCTRLGALKSLVSEQCDDSSSSELDTSPASMLESCPLALVHEPRD
ncbi:hypothetical protein PLEOSDRAFT_163821 [Pleurotus ostreatus PC15]|uniref:Uncharacterized protein n=1 Tax=Pleurotus ostreatus (strain PC15) TaxID=1137138 RepID=A0A067NGQ9_PLEO1|nr:hypothetical protein PLEOSDRAFT_163821 [Pleurotus ostreatus PC15]